MNTIYFVRHGESEVNITKEFSYKVVDKPLTPKGILQAEQTGTYFSKKRIDEIYCSPMLRASQTAGIIGKAVGLEPVEVEYFREVNVGSLELTPPTKENWNIYFGVTNRWMEGETDIPLPDGETADELTERLRKGLTDINSSGDGRTIVIVTHGGIVYYSLHRVLDAPWKKGDRDKNIHNCAVTTVRLEPHPSELNGIIETWMESGHIEGPAANFIFGVPDDDESVERYGERFSQK